MIKNPFVSVVMPALNEEKNILLSINNALKAFDNLKIDGEVIVINDGSSDKTSEQVEWLISKEGKRIRMVGHDTPQGIGASFWDGVSNANGEVICMLPGDNENDPHEILRYLKLLDDVDMVIPFVYNKRNRTLFRNILSHIWLVIIDITFGVYFNYTNGTILYRRSILESLDYRSHSFFFQADILVRLAKRGYLFAEVPYRLGLRKTGRSKAITFRNVLQVAKDYFRLVRDIYFKKQTRLKRYKFSENSISAQRYRELEGFNGQADTGCT